jgi:hypothetical protein
MRNETTNVLADIVSARRNDWRPIDSQATPPIAGFPPAMRYGHDFDALGYLPISDNEREMLHQVATRPE